MYMLFFIHVIRGVKIIFWQNFLFWSQNSQSLFYIKCVFLRVIFKLYCILQNSNNVCILINIDRYTNWSCRVGKNSLIAICNSSKHSDVHRNPRTNFKIHEKVISNHAIWPWYCIGLFLFLSHITQLSFCVNTKGKIFLSNVSNLSNQ